MTLCMWVDCSQLQLVTECMTLRLVEGGFVGVEGGFVGSELE